MQKRANKQKTCGGSPRTSRRATLVSEEHPASALALLCSSGPAKQTENLVANIRPKSPISLFLFLSLSILILEVKNGNRNRIESINIEIESKAKSKIENKIEIKIDSKLKSKSKLKSILEVKDGIVSDMPQTSKAVLWVERRRDVDIATSTSRRVADRILEVKDGIVSEMTKINKSVHWVEI